MGAFDLAVEPGRGRFDVDVADPSVQDVVAVLGGELGPLLVWITSTRNGRRARVVEELDGRLLVAAGVGAEHAETGAVVDGGGLVELLAARAARAVNFTSTWTRCPGCGFP